MKRRLALLSLLFTVSCSHQPPANNPPSLEAQCPEFPAPRWKPLDTLQFNPQYLLDQQTFALHPKQDSRWFIDTTAKLIGLCILPIPTSWRPTNDCGTIYVTYHKKDEQWLLLEQQMRICPG